MLSGLQRWMELKLVISAYGINCQYRVNVRKRLAEIRNKWVTNEVSLLLSMQKYDFPPTRAGVGKFHEPAHKTYCRLQYSFHYLPGAVQTDGQAPERIWALVIFLGLRTHEMSCGHKLYTIVYLHGYANWRRTCGIGTNSFLDSTQCLCFGQLFICARSTSLPTSTSQKAQKSSRGCPPKSRSIYFRESA